MATPKHTRGPWRSHPRTYGWIIEGADGYCIGEIADNNGEPCNLANANLTINAPDLYEALEEVTRKWDETLSLVPREGHERAHETLAKCQRALAKARGEVVSA